MRFLPLIWAALWRRRVRSLFTLLSIVVAFLLFGMLQGVNAGFNRAIERSNVDRLMVANSISFTESLPYSYMAQMESLPGVARVTHLSWFSTYYQDQKNFVFSFPTEPERLFAVYSELKLPPEQLQALIHTRTGAVVGADLARKYGWKIGDRVPLHSTIWTKPDNTSDWTFDIVGIYECPSDRAKQNAFYFNYSYFDEGRSFDKGNVGWYAVQVKDPQASAQVAAAIDHLFANSPDETKTQTEKEFQQAFLKQIGDINFIVSRILFAVFFALLFATGNTMMQSVRERVPELAVMKTLGFSDGLMLALVLGESALLCLFAALVGLAAAAGLFPLLKDTLGVVKLPPEVIVEGAVVALLLALVTGILPAWRAKRLDIVEALRG
jgi:putative ABC transport system permease protein